MTITLGSICREHGREFLSCHGEKIPQYQKTALWCLTHCKTERLGGYRIECAECKQLSFSYKSCRHRGCPQCEGAKEAAWLNARQEELLPTHYFHVVFTVPHVLNELFLRNQPHGFSILFSAVSKTLSKVVGDKLGGAKIGFFSILHTWGQMLDLHPHIHCVVPGGGIGEDGNWVSTSKKAKFLCSTKVLAEVFRGILLSLLRRAHKRGMIQYEGNLEELFNVAVQRTWVVHAAAPFGSPLHVLKYLSRYTRKVAISNSRLLTLEKGMVAFRFKDYATEDPDRVCRMNAVEFIRRFLMHVPKPGFVRIRYYGFMAGKGKKLRIKKLQGIIAGLLPCVLPVVEKIEAKKHCCPLCGSTKISVFLLPKGLIKPKDSS